MGGTITEPPAASAASNVAATVAQVESLGGTVLMPAEDTPYGTLATVTDPFGAAFSLGHPPAGM